MKSGNAVTNQLAIQNKIHFTIPSQLCKTSIIKKA